MFNVTDNLFAQEDDSKSAVAPRLCSSLDGIFNFNVTETTIPLR